MSMNHYMHPRNIYKQPPNFKQLAIEYPEFRKFAIQDISGKVSVDFKNVEALRALTCTLLKKDFSLDVNLPLNKLIPTVPLRLNYVLWIEDLLSLADRSENVRGLDIGTGASCVYALMGAKKNNWAMVGTEVDAESIKYAIENVKRNNLDTLIQIQAIKDKTSLLNEVLGSFDFCMCNPPFFASAQELHPFFKARKQSRPHPKNAFCAAINEVVVPGGEVEYITRLINESRTFGNRIKIYTTMVGHKASLPTLKKRLREIEVVSFKQTEFCQGHTTRWGLAWTFDDIDLTKIPQIKQKAVKPLFYEVPRCEKLPYKMSFVLERLLKIFKELQFEYQEIKHVGNLVEFSITAYANTWSHQRRKRREKQRLSVEEVSNNNSGDIHQACDKLAELSCNGKRSCDDDDGFYTAKRVKTGLNDSVDSVFLKAKVGIVKVESSIGLELLFFGGSGTKEALHQVLQYLKNNLMKED